MNELTPITRIEKIISGDELKPITRNEKIVSGEDITPITREEYFLKEYAGGGGITPEGTISITQNGTGIDVSQYAEADVNVPTAELFPLTITNNSTKVLTVTFPRYVDGKIQTQTGSFQIGSQMTDAAVYKTECDTYFMSIHSNGNSVSVVKGEGLYSCAAYSNSSTTIVAGRVYGSATSGAFEIVDIE